MELRRRGWTTPILVDAVQGVIAGHGRLAAARKLGLVDVPVIELAHLSPAQKRAYVIADNQLALNAGWDDSVLAQEVATPDSPVTPLYTTTTTGSRSPSPCTSLDAPLVSWRTPSPFFFACARASPTLRASLTTLPAPSSSAAMTALSSAMTEDRKSVV